MSIALGSFFPGFVHQSFTAPGPAVPAVSGLRDGISDRRSGGQSSGYRGARWRGCPGSNAPARAGLPSREKQDWWSTRASCQPTPGPGSGGRMRGQSGAGDGECPANTRRRRREGRSGARGVCRGGAWRSGRLDPEGLGGAVWGGESARPERRASRGRSSGALGEPGGPQQQRPARASEPWLLRRHLQFPQVLAGGPGIDRDAGGEGVQAEEVALGLFGLARALEAQGVGARGQGV